jgi:radical SAM protein (TIGR01212 family)
LGSRGCSFCDGAGAFAEAGPIADQIAAAKRRVAAKVGADAKYIAYFQSFTNTYAPVSRLETLYRQAIGPEDIVGLAIGTRPDCLPEEVVALLAQINREKPVSVELGLQTIHDRTAENFNRGYATEAFQGAISWLFNHGLETVVAGAFEINPASMRVMEKCGMTKRDYTDEIEYRGVTHTCIYYAISKDTD